MTIELVNFCFSRFIDAMKTQLLFALLLALIVCPRIAQAQNTHATDTTHTQLAVWELGINVTGTISAFLGSGATSTPDPYIFSAKWIKGKHGIRTAFNIRLNNQTENSTDLGGTRDISDLSLRLRGGYERRVHVSKHVALFWGIDLVGIYDHSEVNFSSFFGNTKLLSSTYGGGGGLAIGIMYHFNKRLAISTESTLYGIASHTQEREFAPPIDTNTNSNQFEIVPTLPSSLYLIVKF